MSAWPPIEEPELLARLALDDAGFRAYTEELVAAMPPRELGPADLERALGYPWARPPGSYRLAGVEVELLEGLAQPVREELIARFSSPDGGRLPVVAIGSNAAPEALARKFAHFPDERDRELLVLTGRLHDFDVGVSPQPALYGAMPATPFPSPGVAAAAALLWVTPTQFTQLAWSELSYRFGRLRTRFDVDGDDAGFEEVLVFVSRFGAFRLDGGPVALAAIPAEGRTAVALTQEQLLDAVAALAIGPEARAEDLVRAVFEDFKALVSRLRETTHSESLPFASERWTPFVSAA